MLIPKPNRIAPERNEYFRLLYWKIPEKKRQGLRRKSRAYARKHANKRVCEPCATPYDDHKRCGMCTSLVHNNHYCDWCLNLDIGYLTIPHIEIEYNEDS